jgi:transcriptional regulator with GAF, ATPase, and Fis domain
MMVDEIIASLFVELAGLHEDLAEDARHHQEDGQSRRYALWLVPIAQHLMKEQCPSRRGRPAEPAYCRDAAEFERRVIAESQLIEKAHEVQATDVRVATALNISRRTLHNYCRRFGFTFKDLVRQFRGG